MRWERGERSGDLEDRRGMRGGRMGGLPGLGLGGVLLLLVLSVVFKQDFFSLLQTVQDPNAGPGYVDGSAPRATSPEEEQLVDFVDFVVKDAQDVWTGEFQQLGQPYERAKLVLFTDSTRSGCGYAEAAMGPFYCPADGKVYIDLGFYRELKSRFGAPGDFAQAYVIAHEVGHHVQTLLGLERRLAEARARRPDDANELSVRFELQADCLAGVWAHSTQQRDLLERGDVEEGLAAAAAVGDDRIQKQSGAGVNPETWTHGSSSQRVAWFTTGFRGGQLQGCDTFAAGGR
jgi:predicted metalloprotease